VPHRGRPLLRDDRRTRAWPLLATCVIVIATLGFLLRGQAQPDGFDSVIDTSVVASFSGHRTGTVLTLAFLVDLVAGVMRARWVGSGILRRDRAVSASGRPAREE
jgi:hypothetical protein